MRSCIQRRGEDDGGSRKHVETACRVVGTGCLRGGCGCGVRVPDLKRLQSSIRSMLSRTSSTNLPQSRGSANPQRMLIAGNGTASGRGMWILRSRQLREREHAGMC